MADTLQDGNRIHVLSAFRLDGKVAAVTGAGRGLGRAMAIALAQAGACVCVLDVESESVERVAEEIRTLGCDAWATQVDVGNSNQVCTVVDEVTKRYQHIDILVNNAGVTSRSPFQDLEETAWDSVLRVNLTGIYTCSKWVARHMIQSNRGGSIINLASISGLVGNRGGNNSHYCATKGGVIALTRSLAVEWAQYGIRVNAIAPGYCVSPMTDRLKTNDPAFYNELVSRIPLGRFGKDEDLAGAVVFLASPSSAYITGHVLVVDGGYTAW